MKNEQKFVNESQIIHKFLVMEANQLYSQNKIKELLELSSIAYSELSSLLRLVKNPIKYNKVLFLFRRVQKFNILLRVSNYKKAFNIINDYKK